MSSKRSATQKQMFAVAPPVPVPPRRPVTEMSVRGSSQGRSPPAQPNAEATVLAEPPANNEIIDPIQPPQRKSLSLPPEVTQKYDIIGPLGEGGMGAVYRARHRLLGTEVAIKVLKPGYDGDSNIRARFVQEGRALAKIRNDHVCAVSDLGVTRSGDLYLVMEYLSGRSLADELSEKQRLPWSEVKTLFLQACDGLQAAHSKGIVHRDLKPENMFIAVREESKECLKILDFGIARLVKQTTGEVGGANARPRTQTGIIVGTPEYCSPEQIKGEAIIDHRTDIWSIGVCIYEALTGKCPFVFDVSDQNNVIYQVISKICLAQPPSFKEAAPNLDIPPQVEALIMKCLAKDRNQRYQSANELRDALLAIPDTFESTEGPEIIMETPELPGEAGGVVSPSLFIDQPLSPRPIAPTQVPLERPKAVVNLEAIYPPPQQRLSSAMGTATESIEIPVRASDEPVTTGIPDLIHPKNKLHRAGLLTTGVLALFGIGLGSAFVISASRSPRRPELVEPIIQTAPRSGGVSAIQHQLSTQPAIQPTRPTSTSQPLAVQPPPPTIPLATQNLQAPSSSEQSAAQLPSRRLRANSGIRRRVRSEGEASQQLRLIPSIHTHSRNR